MIVDRPIADVFAMFENPYNLAILTPPWLNFRVTSKAKVEMRPGAEIEYRFQWLGLPMHWKTRISSYAPPSAFVDEALRSPYVFWHHLHTFEPVEGGTLVRDVVDYQLPLGPLGWLAHAVAVRYNLIAIFTFRQRTLNSLWGGNARIRWPEISWIESPRAVPGTASPAGQSQLLPSSPSPLPRSNQTD